MPVMVVLAEPAVDKGTQQDGGSDKEADKGFGAPHWRNKLEGRWVASKWNETKAGDMR